MFRILSAFCSVDPFTFAVWSNRSIDVVFFFCSLFYDSHICNVPTGTGRWCEKKNINNNNNTRTNSNTAGYNIVVQQPELSLWQTTILLSFDFGHFRVRNALFFSLFFIHSFLLCRPFRFSCHIMPINYDSHVEHVLCVCIFSYTHAETVDMALAQI